MFVVVPVSSMKTSRLGSIEGCLSRHSSRAALTSSRSCSAACSVFFKADPVTIEEAPQSRNAGRKGFVRSQTPADFHQRQVRLLGDQREQPIFVRLDRSRAAVTTGWLGLPATSFLEALCQRIALLTLTLNAALAPRRDLPAFTAPITRSRKSAEH